MTRGAHLAGRERTNPWLPESKWKLALFPAAVPWETPPPAHSNAPSSVVCFALHKVSRGKDKIKAGAKAKKKKKKEQIARGDCALKKRGHLPWLTYLRKQRLTYCFLTDIGNLRRTSIRALSHSALRNSSVLIALSDHFDILFLEQCRVDASPASSLPAKLKVILRE